MNRSRALLVLPTMLLVGAVSAGCGSSDDDHATSAPATTSTAATTTIESGAQHNDADVAFLQGMYPHHAQAIGMAEMVDGRTDNAELVALAGQIEAAQAPEMDQMVTLLEQFGEPAPMGPDAMDNHMGGDTDGMLTPDQMQALMTAEGPEFDRLWLEGMIAHHEGAIEMSDTVIAEGSNPDVRTMAESIVETQQAEIDQMRTMLGQ